MLFLNEGKFKHFHDPSSTVYGERFDLVILDYRDLDTLWLLPQEDLKECLAYIPSRVRDPKLQFDQSKLNEYNYDGNQILDEIAITLEIRGYPHCANAESIGHIVDELNELREERSAAQDMRKEPAEHE